MLKEITSAYYVIVKREDTGTLQGIMQKPNIKYKVTKKKKMLDNIRGKND